jgi:SagB-type dehydrogenase family enzyme
MKIGETASINQIGFASQFVDRDVEYQVREFHQSCITPVGSGFENLFGFPALTPAHLKRAEFVETRFSHLTQTIDIPREEAVESVGRFESLRHGDADIEIEFSLIGRIFAQALAADQQRRRPYPSGGALYAVEAVLITGPRVGGGQSLSALHFLPVSNAFEVLNAHVSVAGFSGLTDIPNPSFSVLYCVNLKKSIFKYRSRGYRLSLLEAGSMYQNMLACAQTFGVSSRVLSGFSERQVAQVCHLDSRLLLPAIVQVFGFEKRQHGNPA